MPALTRDNQSRYRTPRQLRNQPQDDLEKEVQNFEVNNEVEKILNKFSGEKEFTRMIAAALARKVLDIDAATNNRSE
jgi:hypothetical protein